jgi:hypothetical protein
VEPAQCRFPTGIAIRHATFCRSSSIIHALADDPGSIPMQMDQLVG